VAALERSLSEERATSARLETALLEAREQQAATSEIVGVIVRGLVAAHDGSAPR
jgi:hypothetical protein